MFHGQFQNISFLEFMITNRLFLFVLEILYFNQISIDYVREREREREGEGREVAASPSSSPHIIENNRILIDAY